MAALQVSGRRTDQRTLTLRIASQSTSAFIALPPCRPWHPAAGSRLCVCGRAGGAGSLRSAPHLAMHNRCEHAGWLAAGHVHSVCLHASW